MTNSFLVSSITWLENNVFLMIHTPSNFDNNSAPSSIFHVVTRHSTSEFMYQKISDPAEPFGLNRSPPHHFLLRLRDFPPSLQDVLIVASTASTDIGLFTRSKTALVADKTADKVTGVFTMTGMSDDSRRAILPMSQEEMSDTSPIGLVLDLSSQAVVRKPIPKDEIDNSPTPVPGVMALNNEGVLAYWWVIYSDSVLQGTAYPGLVAAGGGVQQITPQSAPIQQSSMFATAAPKLAFAQPAFGASSNPPSDFSSFKPTQSAFGSPSAPGGSSSTAFGAASGLNKAPSPWGTPANNSSPKPGSTFGTPAFGSTTGAATNLSFGSATVSGNRASPWATGSTKPVGSAFGQPSGLGLAPGTSPFGSSPSGGVSAVGGTSHAAPSGGFASFANTGGFAAAVPKGNGSGSVFGSNPIGNSFSAPQSSLALGASTSFGGANAKDVDKPKGLFGGDGFTLSSTFKPDGSAKDDGPKPTTAGSSFFGSGFGSTLNETDKTSIVPAQEVVEADMQDEPSESVAEAKKEEPVTAMRSPFSDLLGTPATLASNSAAPKVQPPSIGLFGSPTIPQSPFSGTGAKASGFSFSKPATSLVPVSERTPLVKAIDTLPASATLAGHSIKQEPQSYDEVKSDLSKIPEAPLPPDITSKNSYAIGDSSVSSIEPDAPLPPSSATTTAPKQIKPQEVPAVALSGRISSLPEPQSPGDSPSDAAEEAEDSADYITEDEAGQSGSQSQSDAESEVEEGSGEDVSKDFNRKSSSNATPGFTPQNSFRGTTDKSNSESVFANLSKPQPGKASQGLFGEIQSKTAPILAPPKDLSPRSPSPVRTSMPGRLLRPDTSRSFSAPGVASRLLGSQKVTSSRPILYSSGTLVVAADQRKAEERQNAQTRAKQEAEESQALIDREDESIQEYLKQEIVGTTRLVDFVAHQDYVSNENKDGIPSQVEALYRDINSMIDTLGINSCSLKSFIKGHSDGQPADVRTREDLDGDTEWCLSEIETISKIVAHDLSNELEQGRIKELTGKLEVCATLEKDLVKLRAKHDDIKMLVNSLSHPDHLTVHRSKSLSAEQATQQNDLRADFTKIQKLLNEAEETLTMLRAQLVSHGRKDGKSTAGPTVEAMMRTIMKMTKMAEKSSGDIDVLENQMRKLRFSSSASHGSREGSPFTTPIKASIRNSGTSSTYGLFYTPDSIKDSHHGLRNSMTSPAYSYRGTPPRKKLSGFTVEDKLRLKATSTRRKGITNKLKEALRKSGTRVRSMDEE